MALNNNYSQQDFQSVYEDLLSIVENSTSKWKPSTSTEADAGVVILKAMAFLEDKSNYRFDMSLGQAYLDSVSDPQSAYELLQMLGYLMKQARAATGDLTLISTSGWPEGVDNIQVPVFTTFTDATNTLKFFATNSYVIPHTDSTYRIEVQAGEPFQITKEGVSYFTLKDVDEQGRLFLGKSGLAQNGVFVLTSAQVYDSNNQVQTVLVKDWTYLDYAILKPTNTLWYTVGTAESGEMFIQFPDNFTELLASLQFTVYATYTDGVASNVAKGVISRFEDDATWRSYFAVIQERAFTNGQDQESIPLAVQHYYETKDICNTLVTPADYVAALRNLIVSAAYENLPTLPAGSNYCTNALVRTAASRKVKISTASFDKRYTLYAPDPSISMATNQVELVALSPAAADPSISETYSRDFARIASGTNLAQNLIQDFNSQLQYNVAVDVDLAVSNTVPRLLAVTKPEITIRLANYTVAAAAAVQSRIQQYFYSTYQAKNLTPGKPLDVQKIIDDIYALSPIISSVFIPDFTYDIYSVYEPVDATDSVKISVLPTEELTPAQMSSDTASWNLRKDILSRSVAQGSVPLYKYYNRQNTPSKSTLVASAYIAVADPSSAVAPLPLTVTASPASVPVSQGQPVFAQVTTFPEPGESTTSPLGTVSVLPIVNDNQLLQIRTPVNVTVGSYGFGMKYKFDHRKPVSAQTTFTKLTAGTRVAVGTVITTTEYDLSADYWTKNGNVYTCWNPCYLESDVVASDHTTILLAAGSAVAPNSETSEGNYFPASVQIPDGQEYCLAEGETLTIVKSSSGEIVEEFAEGDVVQATGTSLSDTMMLATQYSPVLTTSMTIASLAPDVSTFTTDYLYFLSLATSTAPLSLDASGGSLDSYMLEENEFLLIANIGITEYLSFGPGTVITNPGSSALSLKNTPLVSLESVDRSMFERLPAELSVQLYNFNTFGKGSIVIASDGASLTESDWADVVSATGFSVYQNISDATTLSGLSADQIATLLATKTPVYSSTTASSQAEYRFVVSVKTDSTGLILLEAPWNSANTSYTIALTQGSTTLDSLQTGEDTGIYLTSTVPVSSVVQGSTPTQLATTANSSFTYGSYSTAVDTQLYGGISVDNSSPVESKIVIGQLDTSTGSHAIAFNLVAPAGSYSSGTTLYLRAMFHVSFAKPLDAFTATLHFKTTYSTYPTTLFVPQYWSSLPGERRYYVSGTAPTLNILLTQSLSFGFDLCAVVQATVTGGVVNPVPLVITIDDPNDTLSYNTITISDMSYVNTYADELGIDFSGTLITSDQVFNSVAALDKNTHRFDYTSLPTENLSYPLAPSSFFASSHPYNQYVFPYIEWDVTKIKILSGRR